VNSGQNAQRGVEVAARDGNVLARLSSAEGVLDA
jgi:hypothetical protein